MGILKHGIDPDECSRIDTTTVFSTRRSDKTLRPKALLGLPQNGGVHGTNLTAGIATVDRRWKHSEDVE
jgi:hypothetical protein